MLAANYGNLTFSNFAKVLPSSGTIGVAGTFTPGAGSGHTITGSTFDFNGAGAQTVPAFSYNNLTISGSRGGAAVTLASGTINVAGAFNAIATSYTLGVTGNTLAFNGTTAQSIGGVAALTLNNLTINNSAGTALNVDATVNGALTLTNGALTTGTKIVSVGPAGTASRTNGLVDGTVRKQFSAAGSFTYPVGAGGGYSPVAATVTAGSGTLSVKANTGTAPSSPALDPARMLQRYWTTSGSGVTANLTFNYLNGDIPGTSTEASYDIFRIASAGYPNRFAPNGSSVVLNAAGNSFTVNGVQFFADWTAGDPLAPTAAQAAIGGRVLSADGAGIGRAMVVVTDQAGNRVSAVTNTFGHYRIEGLATGETYVVTVTSKGYSFAARSVTLSEDVASLDFVAGP